MTHSDEEVFLKIKAEADAFYRTLTTVRCPAPIADIHFTSDGFHHLRFNGARVERTKAVQKIKMLCIKEVVDVIRKTTTIQEFRAAIQPVGKANKNGFRETKRVEYYAFHAITNLTKPRRINVVVRRVGEGYYHFWSVMPSWKEEKINEQQAVRCIGGRWMIDI